ncbi:MAG: hypothetical protein Q8M98_04225 [Candidatus Cloacimonadaceae bacterium]|nr:hypothetical protein [Candidatus Cloacimonadaceae bacterium]
MMMFRKTFGITLSVILILFATACTRKTNPTGNNWSDVRPLSFTDSTSFDMGFSYAATKTVSGNESNLLVGNFEGLQAAAVMRFTGLPKDFSIPVGYQDSTYLELTLVRRSPLIRYPVNLDVYKLNQVWAADSTNSIQDANMTLISTQCFTIPDTVLAAGTEVRIPIPVSAIQNWFNASDADTLGWNLVIKSNVGAWVEMRATETGRGPSLRFKYFSGTPAAEKEYKNRATRDSYRVDTDLAPLLTDQWVIRNISPSRIYVKFLDNFDLYKDMNGAVLDALSRQRLTINKAELIFHVKENPYYGSSVQYSLRGDRVSRDSILTAIELTDTDAVSGITTTTFIRGDSVVVNITPLVQGYTSGNQANKGVIIRSMQEMLNFGKLELWHFNDAPAGKKPKLRVTYTPPYL